MGIESVGLLLWVLLTPSYAYWNTGHCPFTKKEFICGSDGITYESVCDFFSAQLSNHLLYIAYRGSCRDGDIFPHTTTLPNWIDPDFPFGTLTTRSKNDDHENEPISEKTTSKPESYENEDSYNPEDSDKPEDSYIPEDSDKSNADYIPEKTDPHKPDDDYKPEETDPEKLEDKPEEEVSDKEDITRRPEEEDTENSAEYPYSTISRNPRNRKRRTTPRITRGTRRRTTRRRTTTKTRRRNKKPTKSRGCILFWCGNYDVTINVLWNKKKNPVKRSKINL